MAEIATSVLHNVGNVLNSVNVSAILIRDGLSDFPIESLTKLGAWLRKQYASPGAWPPPDQKGEKTIALIESLTGNFDEIRDRLIQECRLLEKNVAQIKEIVAMQ